MHDPKPPGRGAGREPRSNGEDRRPKGRRAEGHKIVPYDGDGATLLVGAGSPGQG